MIKLAMLSVLTCMLTAAELPTRTQVAADITQFERWILQQQQADGAFIAGDLFSLGITALSVQALAQEPSRFDVDDAPIKNALAFLQRYQQADGGVYKPSEGLANYVTAMTLTALAHLQTQPEWQAVLKRYLIGGQNDEAGSASEGGWGYLATDQGREDGGNTGTVVEALAQSGVPADDPAMQRALVFMQRTQNLSSHNTQPWAGNDGSAAYAVEPKAPSGGVDNAPPPKGRNPGYGGMTYNLIKTYLYLGLKPGDPRLDAAKRWVLNNYAFDANPGLPEPMKQAGLFYYYHSMAKTFASLGEHQLQLPDGSQADWRADLYAAIKEQMRSIPLRDGQQGAFVINSNQRWGEGLPQIPTAYCLFALKYIHQSLPVE